VGSEHAFLHKIKMLSYAMSDTPFSKEFTSIYSKEFLVRKWIPKKMNSVSTGILFDEVLE